MADNTRSAKQLITDIEDMKVKGAYLITCVALEALTLLTEETVSTEAPLLDTLTAAAKRLKTAQPSMASVANACAYVLNTLMQSEAPPMTVPEIRQLVTTRSREFLAGFEQAQQQVIKVGSRVVHDGDVIFIHSYTGTLLAIFSRTREEGKQFQVIATESRPYCEGRVMVTELLKLGIPCTLIIDAAMGSYIKRASKALVGSDSILANGSVINKMGTQLLAFACHAYGVPLYAARSILKLSLESLQGGEVKLLERPDDGEIAPSGLADGAALRVENRIFDVTPAQYIEALITDKGVLPPAAIVGFRNDPLLSYTRPH